MIDLEIRYPDKLDILPVTDRISVNLGENINALRDAILNIEQVLGLDVNIGLFTPDPTNTTVASRLTRIERGIAERNLVFREINVSDALTVLLNQSNQPSVILGNGEVNNIAPVTVLGPLTVLSPQVPNPETLFQTPVRIDVTTFNSEASAKTLIKGKSNVDEPLLWIQDTNDSTTITNNPNRLALKVQGNMLVTGKLQADFSVDHTKVLNIETVPTEQTRGSTRHVTQGDYHTHRKGRYDESRGQWIVDSSTDVDDLGIINHRDLEGVGTLPTHGNDYSPLPGVAYHVTGGDLHSHKSGDGAQVDHNDLKNINPKFSNHVTGGDSHDHTNGRGAQIDHSTLSNIGTSGADDIHVTKGSNHRHEVDEDGNPIGDGEQINHSWLSNIVTTGDGAIHVTNGDSHTHSTDGDGGQIDHNDLANIGSFTHSEIDSRITSFRKIKTGTAAFTSVDFDEVDIAHGMGTDQFILIPTVVAINSAPPSDPSDVGVIYVDTTTRSSTSVTLKRVGGAAVGPATKAQVTVASPGADNDLTFIARQPGLDGNDITIEYRDDAGALGSDPIKIVAVTTPASITVIFDSSTPPTAEDIRAGILSDSAASLLVDILVAEGTGAGTVSDGYGPTNLSGGQDATGFISLDIEWIAVATN